MHMLTRSPAAGPKTWWEHHEDRGEDKAHSNYKGASWLGVLRDNYAQLYLDLFFRLKLENSAVRCWNLDYSGIQREPIELAGGEPFLHDPAVL